MGCSWQRQLRARHAGMADGQAQARQTAIAAAPPTSRWLIPGPTDPTRSAALGVDEMLVRTCNVAQGPRGRMAAASMAVYGGRGAPGGGLVAVVLHQ